MKLELHLIPQSSFYQNVRKLLGSRWDTLSRQVRSERDFTCEICGTKPKSTKDVHLHELWSFDDDKKVQKLIGFQCVCVDCHNVHHWGLSQIRGLNMNILMNHACKVNKCDSVTFKDYVYKSFADWQKRSQIQWTLDMSELEELCKVIQCPLISTACHHRNWQYRYGCDKEDKKCAARQMELENEHNKLYS